MKLMVRLLLLTWIVVFLACRGGAAHQRPVLTPAEASDRAVRETETRLPSLPASHRAAFVDSKAGTPLLVARQNNGDSYYLVPFQKDDLTTLVVILDARSGRFKEAAKMATPEKYPPVDAGRAREIIREYLAKRSELKGFDQASPELVWAPCRQSQSPFEPLWRFSAGGSSLFVDQTGYVSDRLEEPALKGGGPPGPESR